MLEFFVGVLDWFKLPIPFYAIVEGFVATVRMRIQFIQNPPFVRNMTISLMGVPEVEVSVEPFTTKLPNVLDLPLIKNFVEMGIAAAVRLPHVEFYVPLLTTGLVVRTICSPSFVDP